ncbi:MAG: hypothetical protein AAGI22_24545 [Planctomycetota bacterium]
MTLQPNTCRSCGSPCRAVPIRHGDGRVEIEGYYCESDGCELRGRNQLHYGEPGFRETEFRADWSARHTAFGRPSQGEGNTLGACRTFVGVLRHDFALPLREEVEILDHNDHPGIDARASWDRGGFLRMQVTRALPSEDYEAQARAGQVERIRGPVDSVELLRAAIEAKSERTARVADISDITPLIDGRGAVDLAFPAPTAFATGHGDWARGRGWESIWVVGPSSAKRLDWSASGPLPPSWPNS